MYNSPCNFYIDSNDRVIYGNGYKIFDSAGVTMKSTDLVQSGAM